MANIELSDKYTDYPEQLLQDLTLTELFSIDGKKLKDFQTAALNKRIQALKDKIPYLSDKIGEFFDPITDYNELEGLLTDPDVFKSYDNEWIQRSNFQQMTRWLDYYTSFDLSDIDASGCRSINDWCQLLAGQVGLEICHSTGTSGKLSFVPRSEKENKHGANLFMYWLQGFADEKDLSFEKGIDSGVTYFFPHARKMFRGQPHKIGYFEDHYTSKPSKTLIEEFSPDEHLLTALMRKATQNGESLEQFKTHPCYDSVINFQENQPQMLATWVDDLIENHQGERIVMFSFWAMLYDLACTLKKKNCNNGFFRQDSVIFLPGGFKGHDLPDGWMEETLEVLGLTIENLQFIYGGSEIVSQMNQCGEGVYHIPPLLIPFLLDPDSGKVLPRKGEQTGQFATYDLAIESYWPGIVFGDKVTINWNGGCRCGRKGPFLYDISRY